MSKAAVPKKAASPTNTTDDDDFGSSSSSSKTPSNPKSDPKADSLIVEAEQKLKKSGFSALFSSGNKYEEAVELYLKAGALYKINKNWNEAGEAYIKAGELYATQLKDAHEACSKYVEAAKALKQVNTSKSVQYYQKAVTIHMEENRFSLASKLWKEIGELYEREMSLDKAQKAFQKAADCYEAESQTANANAMHVKVAQLAADQEKYEEAISIYERVAESALQSSTGKWSVKDYFFKSLLCWLVVGAKKGKMEKVKEKVLEYKDQNPQFDGTREVKLIESLAEKFEEEDVDGYTDAVFEYDQIFKLDNWSAKVLLEVKTILKKGGVSDDTEDGEDAVGV